MTKKDNRSNLEKLEAAGDLGSNMAAFLLERGCEVFRGMTFLVNGSPAIANGILYFAADDGDAYHEFLKCGTTDELKRVSMDPVLMASAPAQEILDLVKKLQTLVFALQHEVAHIVTGKANVFSVGPNPDPNNPHLGMDFDFNLGNGHEKSANKDKKETP